MTKWLGILVITLVPLQAAADERTPSPEPQQVTIRLSEFRFDPSQVEVQRGRPIELHLVNTGKVLHEFVSAVAADTTVDLETGGVVALVRGVDEIEVPPGATVILRFTPTKAGQFAFRCDAEAPVSHHEAGMKGTLVVR